MFQKPPTPNEPPPKYEEWPESGTPEPNNQPSNQPNNQPNNSQDQSPVDHPATSLSDPLPETSDGQPV